MDKDFCFCETDQDGQVIKGRKPLTDLLKSFAGCKITVTVEKSKGKRSDLQNRYYWGCVVPHQIEAIKELWGYILNKDECHTFNKNNYFSLEHLDEETGEVTKIPQSSTMKNKTQFAEIIEKIRQDFQEKFNHYIPSPGEQIEVFN